MMNTTNTNIANGVNRRVSAANSVAPGRLSVENQAEAGRHHAIGDEQNVHQKYNQRRKKWIRNDNMRLMECYILAKSDPKMEYIKRMLRIWREREGKNDVDREYLIRSGSLEEMDYCLNWSLKRSRERWLKHQMRKPK